LCDQLWIAKSIVLERSNIRGSKRLIIRMASKMKHAKQINALPFSRIQLESLSDF
jgi:hypothetical protein